MLENQEGEEDDASLELREGTAAAAGSGLSFPDLDRNRLDRSENRPCLVLKVREAEKAAAAVEEGPT